jgi:hypothetical protein
VQCTQFPPRLNNTGPGHHAERDFEGSHIRSVFALCVNLTGGNVNCTYGQVRQVCIKFCDEVKWWLAHGKRKPQLLAKNAWLAGWLEFANDGFYLIGSAVFQ